MHTFYYNFVIFLVVYAGQQARILGENYTIEDEEDSRVGTVRIDPSTLYDMFKFSFVVF